MDLVLRAVRGVHAALGPVHLIVFGRYSPRDKLRNRAARQGLAARTHLIGDREDLPEVYAALNVFVLAGSSSEAAGALLEAQSMEVPVVCTRFEGADELVAHGTTGFVTNPGDAEALASAIARLLGNPRDAQALAAAGRLRAMQRFRAADRGEAVAATYRRAMDQA
jgi:glycosyltransferase involved in cell wall biosynthesis